MNDSSLVPDVWQARPRLANQFCITPWPHLLLLAGNPRCICLQLIACSPDFLVEIKSFREVIRVGGKVQVFSSTNRFTHQLFHFVSCVTCVLLFFTRKKRKIATLLAYNPVAATASVVYDVVTTKKVIFFGP